MASFDVVSLFTNVPVDLAVRVAKQRLQQDHTLADRTSLEVEEAVELLGGSGTLLFEGQCTSTLLEHQWAPLCP